MDKLSILKNLIEDPHISQSFLSKKCGLSLGKCNYLLNELEELGYLKVDKKEKRFTYYVTSKGKDYFKNELEVLQNLKIPNELYLEYKKPRTAVILAAGYKKDFDKPVSLISISGEETIIDRNIRILENNGIEHFIVVCGYQGDQFYTSSIAKKGNVQFVENTEFQWTGTMFSLSLAADFITNDFILLEDDILIEEKIIQDLIEYPYSDCLLLSKEGGSGEETYVEIRNNSIFRISKEVQQFNSVDGELIGISKISKDYFNQMLQSFKENNNPYQGYEYAMMDIGRKIKLNFYKPVDFLWGEIDTKDQVKEVIGKTYQLILEKEKKQFENKAKELFADIMNCNVSDITEIHRLGGLTNKNFQITANGVSYAFRIPGDGTEKIINRKIEAFNARVASAAGVDNELIYFNEDNGLKIASMIENPETLNPKLSKKEENIKLVANLLRTLHKSGLEMANKYDSYQLTDDYLKLLKASNTYLFEGFEEFYQKTVALKAEYESMCDQLVPCHNDCLPENFIKSGSGRLYLIDWEYSGMNEAVYDVASFSLECSFTELEEELLLKEYFQTTEITEIQRKKVLMGKILSDFLWCVWARQMESEGADYGTYAYDRFKRGEENLALYYKQYKKIIHV